MISLLKKPLASADLSDQTLISWLRLSRSENIGPVSFLQLMSLYSSAESALDALPTWARRGGRSQALRICSVHEAEQELEALTKFGAELISLIDPRYPEILKNIHDPPPLLSIKGQSNLFSRQAVGIVGARNASLNGKKLAQSYARGLGEYGYAVVSGMARGIDTAAHEGSMSSGTIAVLAGGINHIYPPENKNLYEEIAEKGLVIAEAPFGTVPQASYFPRRNRLISGFGVGVVIVEAAIKSGSLITARFALEQGRDVFAVPGSPLDPRCHGTNQLIRQGATLVQSAQDIVQGLQNPFNQSYITQKTEDHPLSELTPEEFNRSLHRARQVILENLSFTPIQVDELIRECDFSHAVVMTVLLELELAGLLVRHSGHQVSLRGEI